MDEVTPHWKRLSFDDDGCIEGEKLNISITSELEAIQERFSKVVDNMKLHIKEQLWKIEFPETIDMKSPSQPVKTKGALKKVKPTPNDNSTTRSPSYFEHLYGKEAKFEAANEAFVPWLGPYAPVSKWLKFPGMRHLIACAYDMVCIDLKRYGFSKTFFPLRTAPPTISNARIKCIGWISKANHFVQVYLKPGCPIPPTSPEWDIYHTEDAETWQDFFVDRMHEFERMNNIEGGSE
ncbi:uncharacterized protein LOC131649047 [Vicia villosa]|uniref:uncharacterized protein LOC131649047 n=1 Tax=Vicia villosa TaxID=3911 RepID=UPI00273C4E4E|nr:uncharacterized protein LOC131649047 [Vicia villosa]